MSGQRSTVNGKILAGWLALAPVVGLQGGPARYTEDRLSCAVFRESVSTAIENRIGSVVRHERTTRDGVLFLQARATDSGLAVTAWYDSLAVTREGPEGRLVPDTEGLLGGRWRGLLSAEGRYRAVARPFIPDEVAEVADLAGLLDDFLPLLPDSALGDGAQHPWTRRSESDSTTVVNDSIAVPVHRESSEAGRLTWDSRVGPERWERTLLLTARIAAGGPVRRGMVTKVTQRVTVVRQAGDCGGGER